MFRHTLVRLVMHNVYCGKVIITSHDNVVFVSQGCTASQGHILISESFPTHHSLTAWLLSAVPTCCHSVPLPLTYRLASGHGIEIRTLSSRSILSVSNMTEDRYDNYTCVAVNKLGSANASVPLIRKPPPYSFDTLSMVCFTHGYHAMLGF